jgi:Putative Holin-like Toxin (Hol-Tox)
VLVSYVLFVLGSELPKGIDTLGGDCVMSVYETLMVMLTFGMFINGFKHK